MSVPGCCWLTSTFRAASLTWPRLVRYSSCMSINCVTESSVFLAAFAQCKSVCESCVEALLVAGLVWSGLSRKAAVCTQHLINDSCHMLVLMYYVQDLCRKCLKHNASCGKAWERLGSILEREQAYKVSFVAHIAKYSLCKARCWLGVAPETALDLLTMITSSAVTSAQVVVFLCRMLLSIMKTPGSMSSNLHQPLATSLHSTI